MERERMRTIAREGTAYGYGLESGRRKAISDNNERKRLQTEWRRDPFGARRMSGNMNQSTRWLLGMPQEKRRKKRRR
jgi:hypothetical protein